MAKAKPTPQKVVFRNDKSGEFISAAKAKKMDPAKVTKEHVPLPIRKTPNK